MNPNEPNPYNPEPELPNQLVQPEPSQMFQPSVPQAPSQPITPPQPGNLPQANGYGVGTPPAQGLPVSQNSKKRGLPWRWMIPIVVLTLLLLGTIGLAFQLFNEKEDYKNNSDQKVAAAVDQAKEEASKVKEAEFIEREKQPYKVYKGPATFGSLSITYPKSWSAMVDEAGSGNKPVHGLFHPNFVPGEKSKTAYALRVEVLEQEYDELLKLYDSGVRTNKVKVSAYKAPKVPSVLGSRIDGEIARGLNGSVILLPIRDKTIKLSVESQSFMKDFNDIILANFVFVP